MGRRKRSLLSKQSGGKRPSLSEKPEDGEAGDDVGSEDEGSEELDDESGEDDPEDGEPGDEADSGGDEASASEEPASEEPASEAPASEPAPEEPTSEAAAEPAPEAASEEPAPEAAPEAPASEEPASEAAPEEPSPEEPGSEATPEASASEDPVPADPYAKAADDANEGTKPPERTKNEEEDDEWFVRTGQPAPDRYAGETETPAPVASRQEGPPQMMWVGAIGAIVVVLLIVVIILLIGFVFLSVLALALATAAAVTPDELGDHRRADDCWIAVHGEVYDVTGFVAAHPGGPVLTAFCGADGTTAFEARPGTGEPHSPDARAILDGMHVGALEGEAKPATAGAWRVLDPMRARTGVVAPTATILGHDQLHFGFAHHFHFPDSPRTNARVELGWGFANVADLVVAHSTWSGESGAQVRVAILQQEGRRRIRSLERRGPAPLSLVTQLSAGYRVAEAIEDAERFVATGQIVAERTFGPASIAIAPGVRYADTVTPYGTALLDLKPHPTGGMFAEVVVSPLGQRIRTRFAAGLRAYTRAHAFTIWGGTSPSLAPGEAASPIGGAGFGFSMERRFPFP